MHPAEHAERPAPERARHRVDPRADRREPGVEGVERHRHEARHVGEDEQADRAGEDQPGRHAEARPRPGVDQVVEMGEGHEQPDRDHPARHRVAEAGAEQQRPRRPPRQEPGTEADDHGAGDGDERRGAGERQRVARRSAGSAGRRGSAPSPRAIAASTTTGSRKPIVTGTAQSAVAARPRQPASGFGAIAVEAAAAQVGLRLSALDALGGGEQEREAEQAERELRRRGAVLHREPRLVDAGREGADVEVGDGAVVGDRLHHREQHAGRDPRPRHRQAHLAEGRPTARARGCAPRGRRWPTAGRRRCGPAGRRKGSRRRSASAPRRAASGCSGTSSRAAPSRSPPGARSAPRPGATAGRCRHRRGRRRGRRAAARGSPRRAARPGSGTW